MFDPNDFKQIINTTTDLLDQIKTASDDDAEEIQLRIDSNIHALQIIGTEIADPELKQRALDIIGSLCATALPVRSDSNIARLRQRRGAERSELVDSEIMRNTQELKRMACKFGESLKTDKQVLQRATERMSKNSVETSRSFKEISEQSRGIGSGTYLFLAILIFVVMYFIIRFV